MVSAGQELHKDWGRELTGEEFIQVLQLVVLHTILLLANHGLVCC